MLSEGGSLIATALSAASCILQHSAPSRPLGPRPSKWILPRKTCRLRRSLSSALLSGALASRFSALKGTKGRGLTSARLNPSFFFFQILELAGETDSASDGWVSDSI